MHVDIVMSTLARGWNRSRSAQQSQGSDKQSGVLIIPSMTAVTNVICALPNVLSPCTVKESHQETCFKDTLLIQTKMQTLSYRCQSNVRLALRRSTASRCRRFVKSTYCIWNKNNKYFFLGGSSSKSKQNYGIGYYYFHYNNFHWLLLLSIISKVYYLFSYYIPLFPWLTLPPDALFAV